MFTLEELFSKRNQREAFLHLSGKPNRVGSDGVLLSELADYWSMNSEIIRKVIEQGKYRPSLIYQTDFIKKSGGKRKISSFGTVDRFILRLLEQKLNRYLNDSFLEHCFAYQENKGVLAAVSCVQQFLSQNLHHLVEIDLHHYFDQIDLEKLQEQLGGILEDRRVLDLLTAYLYASVSYQGQIHENTIGLIQGSAISPVLSNLYLKDFDQFLESKGWNWLRYADNIYIYCKSKSEAQAIYKEATEVLVRDFALEINQKKSGVFASMNRRVLGYDFLLREGEVICQKHQYTPLSYYSGWHPSQLNFVNRQYHIVEGDILNQKDYSLLFENEEHRYHLPIEAVEQIDIYSDVIIAPRTLKLLAQKRIPLVVHNDFGNIQAYFIPETMKSPAPLLLKQCQVYLDEEKRLLLSRQFELSHFHNLRANCRYYLKRYKSNKLLLDIEKDLTMAIKEVHRKKSVDDLMLLEARVKQIYYPIFNEILNQSGFSFVKRTKRPPRDPLNALISFCNTILYSRVLRLIWQARLDPKIGVLHASNNRPYSLHLDFADYMKPVIVDRVILSLINKHQINATEHFEEREDGSVYLNREGKYIVLRSFEEKLQTRLVMGGSTYTYAQLIQHDIRQFKRILQQDGNLKRFKPYKYY